MKITGTRPFDYGYNDIINLDGEHSEVLMDFGILRLGKGQVYESSEAKERAYLLVEGGVKIEWEDQSVLAERSSWRTENPWCLSVPANVPVKIIGVRNESEITVHKTLNEVDFSPKIFTPNDVVVVERGMGVVGGTMERLNRLVIDRENHPESRLILAECQPKPGRWCGFPDHYHPHPEIYYFKFYPKNGYALQRLGNEACYVEDGDTVTLTDGQIHTNCTAPGYYLNYIWCIHDVPDNPYRPIFEMQHTWVPGTWVSEEEMHYLPL